ncbi:MAG: HAD-IA family hydrolase [Candidatus Woesearchaeota archaeon]|nr:HAD-IA family hydrolase [Candidatus Woesearchaeota archaeon]
MTKHYKAIFFDAARTLIEPFPSAGHIYSEVAESYSVYAVPEKIGIAFKEEFSIRKQSFYKNNFKTSEEIEKNWWHDLVYAVFKRFDQDFVDRSHFEGFFNELFNTFAEPKRWKLYDDVKPTLTELKKKGKILGIVSNFDSRLLALYHGKGLNKYFDFVTISAKIGVYKPGRGIFRNAIKKSGVHTNSILHIGDSLKDDGEGARNAGIDFRLLVRPSDDGAITVSHDGVQTISSLNDILEI